MKALVHYQILLLFVIIPGMVNTSMAQHWEYVNPKPNGNNLLDIRFSDASTGFICGEFGTLLKSADGGNSWAPVQYTYSNPPGRLWFSSPSAGFILGGIADEKPAILKTTNGGQTWNILNTAGYGSFTSLCFRDPMTGYAGGLGGLIMITMDGGATWFAQLSGTSQPVNSICITSDNSAFAAGPAGTVLRTTDMGVGVKPPPLPSASELLVYPNPSSDMITIKTGVVSGICRLSVLDIMGSEVLAADIAGPASQIDISRLPGGIYILKLTNGGSLSYAKFIKR